jgi:ribonuclease BN (tRNA processing enzyme)
MRQHSLTCLGVGDGLPCADRNHAAFLYRLGGASILIDCGEPVDGRLKAAGLGPDRLNAIFISHTHADHLGGFFMLMQGLWLEGRRETLTVHLPAPAIPPLRAMLRASMLYSELLPFRLRFAPLKVCRAVSVRGARVTPFRTTHLDDLRARLPAKYRREMVSYSFLLEAGGRRIGHSADLGEPRDLEPLLAQPLDLLVCELAHFPPESIFSFLRGRRIRRVVFVHLGRTCWNRLGSLRRLARKRLPGIPAVFARDGAVIAL